jgi:glycosyltransferase involved in cell wall biosynthesis
MRVALLTNLLTPYRIPVFRDLSATPGWRLRVLVSRAADPRWTRAYAGAFERGRAELEVERVRGPSFPRRFVSHTGDGGAQSVVSHVPLGALAALRRFAPDVIVSGELGLRSWLAWLYARRAGVPLVLWTYPSRSVAATWSPLGRGWRGALLGQADAVVGMGAQAREVLRGLGVPTQRLFDAPNAHDAEAIEHALAGTDVGMARHGLRAALGARERICLVAGRLVAPKGLRPLLVAWTQLPADLRAHWTLLFVGDGPLRGEIEAAAARAAPGEIALAGALPAARMAELYTAADLLVFASLGDPWGLVVNEALACGLPVLCSRLAGCADDLVSDGENGWVFDPTDATAFAAALARALGCPHLARLGARARDTAKRFGPEVMAAGLRRAITSAVARRGPGDARHA